MKIKNIWLLIFWIALISIGSCARRGVPTGGPKDTIPPTLINMRPMLETVNFNSNDIILEFDEYIEARSLKQDIIINPPVKEYDFYVNRRSLVIELNEDLQENTTYTFNFRNAIKDISEQNPAENIIMAFSTGEKIDSFQVQGQIRDLFTNQPAKDVLVALYPEGDTLNPFEDPPTYLTKTDDEGNYAIRYIRVGTYKIFAYNDQNNNLLLDSNNEAFGFESDPVVLIPEEAKEMPFLDTLANRIDSINIQRRALYGKVVNLQMLKQDVRPIVLQSARANGRYFEIKTNKPLINYELFVERENLSENTIEKLDSLRLGFPQDTTRYVYSNFQDDQKTIRVYNTIAQDSLEINVTLRDSVGQEIIDTVHIKFSETRRDIETLKQNLTSKSEINNLINAKISFNKPIINVNTDSILISYDTLFYIPLNYEELIGWNKDLDEISLQKQINRNQLLDSIISYQNRRDEEDFTKSQIQNRLYLDSLRSTDELDQQLQYFERLSRSISSLRLLRDSINTLDGIAKSRFLSGLADTLQVEESYQTKTYDREELNKTLKPLVLYIAEGSFISIENDSSQQIIQRFSFKKPSDYGTITGRINTDYQNYTLQLLNNKYEIVAELKPTNTNYTFDLVPPGSYHIRILIDENQDSQWDRGNILENRNSEPVYFYTDEEVIDLRANWTREINLTF